MARISTEYISNFDESKESAVLAKRGQVVHYPAVANHSGVAEDPSVVRRITDEGPAPEKLEFPNEYPQPDPLDRQVQEDEEAGDTSQPEGVDGPSAGTSSSTSGSKQDKSGSSPQGTGRSHQSPAPGAASPSSQPLLAQPAPASSAPSTSGSTQGTGQPQVPQPGSSGTTPEGTASTPRTPSEEEPSAGGFVAPGT